MNLLNDLYLGGADFVDFHGDIDNEDKQHKLTVSVPMDYMSEESKASLHQEEPPLEEMKESWENEVYDNEGDKRILTEKDIMHMLKHL